MNGGEEMPTIFGEFNVHWLYAFGIVLIYFIGRMFLMIKIIFRLIYNGLIGGAMLWILNYGEPISVLIFQ